MGFAKCCQEGSEARGYVRRGEIRVCSQVFAAEEKTECSDQRNINGILAPEHSPRCTDAVFHPNVGFAVADGHTRLKQPPQAEKPCSSLAAALNGLMTELTA